MFRMTLKSTVAAIALLATVGAAAAYDGDKGHTETMAPPLVPSEDPAFDHAYRLGYGDGALDFESCMYYAGKYHPGEAAGWVVSVTVCRQWMLRLVQAGPSEPKLRMEAFVDDWLAKGTQAAIARDIADSMATADALTRYLDYLGRKLKRK